ncbi:MAG: hypothetical protein IT481_14740 [Gammaproteobacteria bacterium]|nr:hypothetical protein [Gammaproteobacteria bacterium]
MLSPRRPGAAFLAVLAALVVTACGGGGADQSGSTVVTPAPGATRITLTGTATFERVPFAAAAGGGLDFARAAPAPARGLTLEALAASGQTVLASTTTDANGQFTLDLPADTALFLRLKAELRRSGAPSWLVTVRDNTAGDALYVVDTTTFNSGAAALRRDVHAGSGWTAGSGYDGARAAAPLAILDTLWQAMQLVLSVDATARFPELEAYWSPRNIGCDEGALGFCDGTAAARARGEIGTSFYAILGSQGSSIYVLGAADIDSDEFDQHVLAHEWGHYYQDNFSRDDSIGGPHSASERLDLRVAFSEGWGNAFAGMVRGDPVYRDSFGTQQRSDFAIDVENNAVTFPGWFSEGSVQSIFYDLFDASNEPGDAVELGFGPVHAAMRGGIRDTSAFTSVYALFNALRASRPEQAAGIAALASGQLIAAAPDDFGSGESNSGGDARNLPIFPLMTPGTTRQLCSNLPTGRSAVYNKLGNRRYLRFTLAVSGMVSIAVRNGRSGTDPDIVLYAAGVERGRAEDVVSGTETLTLPLQAGTYVAEIYEYSNVEGTAPRGNECFDVTLTVS